MTTKELEPTTEDVARVLTEIADRVPEISLLQMLDSEAGFCGHPEVLRQTLREAAARIREFDELLKALPMCEYDGSTFGLDPTCRQTATAEVDNSFYHYLACDEHKQPDFSDLPWAAIVRRPKGTG